MAASDVGGLELTRISFGLKYRISFAACHWILACARPQEKEHGATPAHCYLCRNNHSRADGSGVWSLAFRPDQAKREAIAEVGGALTIGM